MSRPRAKRSFRAPLTRPAVLVAGFLATAAALSGCQSASPAVELDDALAGYQAGRYQEAHEASVELLRSASPAHRDEAAYLAGLSAYRLGDLDEAELRLEMAAGSSDAQLAARARAMLGVIRYRQGRNGDAVELLAEAAGDLGGDDADRAARLAESASRRGAVAPPPVRLAALTGGAGSTVGDHGGMSERTTATAGAHFTLQAGAFLERHRAEAAADEVAGLSMRADLRPVQIITTSDDRGRPLYLVQFGRFVTRGEAATTRQVLGRQSYIVAPVETASR